MDRNSVIGIVLIVAILFGYTWYTMPSEEELAAQQRSIDSLATLELEKRAKEESAALELKERGDSGVVAQGIVDTSITQEDRLLAAADSALVDSLRSAALAQKFSVFQPASQGTAEEVTIANDHLQVSISTHGARPTMMLLKQYQTYHKTPLLLSLIHIYSATWTPMPSSKAAMRRPSMTFPC